MNSGILFRFLVLNCAVMSLTLGARAQLVVVSDESGIQGDQSAEIESVVRTGQALCVNDIVYFIGESTLDSERQGLNLYRMNLAGGQPLPLLPSGGGEEMIGGALEFDPQRGRALLTSPMIEMETGLVNCLTLVGPEPGEVQVVVDNGRQNTLATFSPDGSEIAFYSATPMIHFQQHTGMSEGGYALNVVDLETGEIITLSTPTLDPFASCPPAWSPDGEWIAFPGRFEPDEGMPIQLVSADGLERQTVRLERGRYYVESVVWPRDDNLIFTEMGVFGVRSASISAGEDMPLIGGNVTGPLSLSPDRQLLLLREENEERQLIRGVYTVTGQRPSENVADRLFQGNWRLDGAEER